MTRAFAKGHIGAPKLVQNLARRQGRRQLGARSKHEELLGSFSSVADDLGELISVICVWDMRTLQSEDLSDCLYVCTHNPFFH